MNLLVLCLCCMDYVVCVASLVFHPHSNAYYHTIYMSPVCFLSATKLRRTHFIRLNLNQLLPLSMYVLCPPNHSLNSHQNVCK